MTAGSLNIDNERAIQIAREAIEGLVELSSPADVQVERHGTAFTVTFPRRNPPGVRAADYDARVTIDAQTGAVVEVLGGS